MSVPVPKRNLSEAEYLFQTKELNRRIGEIMTNKPKKYKTNYADKIINAGLDALGNLQIVDSVYFDQHSSEEEYRIRREALLKAKGYLAHVSTASDIFLEIVKHHDYASEEKNKHESVRIAKQQLEIGGRCQECINLIDGVLKYDKGIYKKYIKPRG